MRPLRHRIKPSTFVITLKQLAKHLQINPERILNWEKWHNVLWIHIQGIGGYFVSYRKLEQWLAACRSLLRWCPDLLTLDQVWQSILQESQRYTEVGLAELETLWRLKYSKLLQYQLS